MGSYALAGGTVQIQRDDGSGTTLTTGDDTSRLQLGNLTLYRVATFNGLLLDGTYYSSTFVNTSAGGTTGSVSGATTITFGPDGRFSANNFAGFAGSGPEAGGTTSSQGGGTLVLPEWHRYSKIAHSGRWSDACFASSPPMSQAVRRAARFGDAKI
ncbi:MAG TPA: hypothetical protein VFE42_18540 [Chloroflexota bacterium]|nr:hypothetical protein [Chloroflexota bacterium]